MTLDTATLRAQWEAIREQQGPAAFAMIAHVGDGIALLDALEAERERVRVLTRIGARIVESEVSRRPGLRSLAIEELRTALATAHASEMTDGAMIIALCDALEAERERVRVLREALEWYGDHRHWTPIISAETVVAGLRLVASGCIADRDVGNRARAALATAGGEGATT